jgi:hypothetical protein
VEVAVRRKQVRPKRQTHLGTTGLQRDELDAEEPGKRALGRRLNLCGIDGYFLPAEDATNFATAVICASVNVPLNAGMIPPPCTTWARALSYGGFS